MTNWSAVVLAWSDVDGGGLMNSRLPAHLHPVAGRPLIWHTVHTLAQHRPRPAEVLIVGSDLPSELFEGLPTSVRVQQPGRELSGPGAAAERVVLAHGAAYLEPGAIRRLLTSSVDAWVAGSAELAAAIAVPGATAREVLRDEQPLSSSNRVSEAGERVEGGGTLVVRNRTDLSVAHRRIRRR